jgi:hypothetical protein
MTAAPFIKKDLEAEKTKTKITEKQTELAREKTKQLLSKSGQARNNAFANIRSPETAGQILINPNNIPKLNLSTNNTSNNNANTSINSTSLAITKPLTSNTNTYNPFGTSTSTLRNTLNNHDNTQLSSISAGWIGLNIRQSGGWLPPDVAIAAGPNHVVEMVNLKMAIWNKNGGLINSANLNTFFGTGNEFISDPKVIFDTLSGHWFASILHGNDRNCSVECSVIVAVSSTPDPTGSWNMYSFPFGTSLPDQPIIATSDNKLVISVNDFDNVCIQGCANVLVADKNAMIVGGSSDYQTTGNMPSEFSLQPAQSLSSTDCVYLTSVGHLGSSVVKLSAWCGNPSGHAASFNPSLSVISIPPSVTPLQGSQPDGKPLDTGDGRMVTAAYYNGKLWWGFNDSCVPNGDTNPHSCLRVQQTDVNNPTTLTVDTYIAAVNYDTFYPALTINNQGQMLFIFGISGNALYPSLIASDSSNWNSSYLTVGSSSVDDGRYGDYFGAGIDPSGQSAWVAGEFGSNTVPNSWNTFIGNIH